MCFFPRMNRSLKEFVMQMNNRPVSTEHNMSPLQMWERGVLQNRNLQDSSLSESGTELYTVDPGSVTQITENEYQINITQPYFDISDDQYSLLLTEDLNEREFT